VNGFSLSYGTKGTELPITKTTTGHSSQCMKPSEASIAAGNYYPTEADFAHGGCSIAKINGLTNDNRYVDTGMQATEYDI
jgi:hypothetical protein